LKFSKKFQCHSSLITLVLSFYIWYKQSQDWFFCSCFSR